MKNPNVALRFAAALRRFAVALSLLAAAPCLAQVLTETRIELPAGQSTRLAIAPGASATLAFSVRNAGTTPGVAVVGGSMGYVVTTLAGYDFVAADPTRCGLPTVVQNFGYYVRFAIGPLAPDESIACSYQVTRAAQNPNDLVFELCGSSATYTPCNRRLWFGTLPALAFRVAQVESVEPGAATALVRLTVDNPGARAVLRRTLTTECSEFGGGIFAPAPFEVETDFAGACPRAPIGEICLNFTGQNFDSRAFDPGPIAAGGSVSCLVRLRFTAPLTQPVSLRMYFRNEVVPFVDGGLGFDPESNLVTAPFGAAPNTPVPLGWPGMALLAVMLALAGWASLRRIGG